MTVSPTTAEARPATTTRSAHNTMSSEDFFKLLVTELQQQDPLEPTKTADMIGQVSQIRNIELSQQLSTTLTRLTDVQQSGNIGMLGALIGKYVKADIALTGGEARQVTGQVTAVHIGDDGVATLKLSTGDTVPLTSVRSIASAEDGAQLANAATSTDPTAKMLQAKANQPAQTTPAAQQPALQWSDPRQTVIPIPMLHVPPGNFSVGFG
jgi:flagellar basal-body rod modification protein FlgD